MRAARSSRVAKPKRVKVKAETAVVQKAILRLLMTQSPLTTGELRERLQQEFGRPFSRASIAGATGRIRQKYPGKLTLNTPGKRMLPLWTLAKDFKLGDNKQDKAGGQDG